MRAPLAIAAGHSAHFFRLRLSPAASPIQGSRSSDSAARLFPSLCQETSGNAAVEYLLLIGLLALAAILSLRGTTSALGTNFSTLGNTVQNSSHH